MSKYEKTDYINEEKDPIVDGEEIIWQGKPKKAAFILNKSFTMFPIALLWILFDGTFIAMMIENETPSGMLYFIIPFFIFHLAPVWIWLANLLTANKRWKNTKYYVTDKRLIIKNGFFAENLQTVYYKDISKVNLHVGLMDKLLGVGDIEFDVANANSENGYYVVYFLDIIDYKDIYQKLQKVVLDMQTDIEYPNALRPDTNPGYNTKYEPKQ